MFSFQTSRFCCSLSQTQKMDHQQIPKDDALLHTAFSMYQSSYQTIALKSEQNRTVFAENFETRNPPPLGTLCLKVIAQNYESHQIPLLKVEPIQLRTYYDFIDENLSIEKCLNINDEHYWKRVFSSICTDNMLVKEKSKQKDISWKNLSVALKYVNLIENTPYERWIPEEVENITKIVSPFVTELKITQFQPMREASYEKKHFETLSEHSKSTISDEENNDATSEKSETRESRYDFPFQECHHVDLRVLRNLLDLNSLTIEFMPPKLSSNYHTRFFNFSYIDVENLASGISELKNLKTLKLRRSRMDSVKFSTILDALESIFIENLEFYFCQLDDDCGESLSKYLISTKSLKHLDLSGNNFKHQAIDYISKGLQTSASQLTYLSLSNNPFCDESLCNLTKSLEPYKYLKVLKLSGIQSSEIGASDGIAKLVKNNLHLVELHMIAVQINGTDLIEALKRNHTIQLILCQGCGLTLDEEFKVEILLERNRYMKANPYIGDVTKTEEEVNAFIKRTKNPIFVKALNHKKQRTKCWQKKSLNSVNVKKSKPLPEEED